MEEYRARTHNATFARSSPTGVNKGSKKVNVRNPVRAADNNPEKNLGLEEESLEYQTIEAANTNRIAGYANSDTVSRRSRDPFSELPIADWGIFETCSD
mmetsp:Transcript_21042/g.51783  ORF Transcript_21042/g.51783 Transcript_21042/m.51783 type:complete len:99 (+) Transcript_21042:6292-6588(+)